MQLEDLLDELAEPFDVERISWKPQVVSGGRALAIAYADARTYQDRLNEVARAEWSDDYEVLDDGAVVLCRLSVCGVTRSDIGETAKSDQNTATSSLVQAFKRACVKFGVGRYLYDLPKKWVDYDPERKRFTRKARHGLRGSLAVLSCERSELISEQRETPEAASPTQHATLEAEKKCERPVQDSEVAVAQSVSNRADEEPVEEATPKPETPEGTVEEDTPAGVPEGRRPESSGNGAGAAEGKHEADNGSEEATPTAFWSLYNKHKNRVSKEQAQEWAATRNWEYALAELRARVE